jgi:dihydrodipicolinate synthase/N-acetylneuraminate lyase
MNQSSSEARPHNCFVPRLGTSVIAVPPLARHGDLRVSRAENAKMIQYLKQGGVRTLLYGGNAVFYHIRPSEYAAAVEMLLEEAGEDMWMIPSIGPAFGTMLDQAELLASMPIDTAMVLPQKEITDPEGIEMGIRHVVERLGKPVVLYLKIDRWLSPAAVARLVRDGMVSWIKYAVVLPDASNDPYLRELLEVVPADLMVSGMGEQPAIVHMQDFGMSSLLVVVFASLRAYQRRCFVISFAEISNRLIHVESYLRPWKTLGIKHRQYESCMKRSRRLVC